MRATIWGFITASALAVQGCATATVSVASMAGGAVVDHVINGEVHHIIPTPIAGAHLAALAAVKQMGMTVEQDQRDGDKWTITAIRGNRISKIQISAAGNKRSRIDVEVSWDELDFIKDPSTANDFLEQMQVEITRLPFRQIQTATAQMLLSDLGHKLKYADGFLDNNTRTAIRGFQRKSGLPADGTVSTELIAALRRQPKGRTRIAPLAAPPKQQQKKTSETAATK